MKKRLIIASFIIIAVILAAGAVFALRSKPNSPAPPADQNPSEAVPTDQSQSETVQAPAPELPQTNPFEEAKTNPFKDIKTNPFE